MKQLLILVLALWVNASAAAQTYTVETVPNTRLVTGTFVSNPDNIISGMTVAKIDSVLRTLEERTTTQAAVVILNSIGDAEIADFSQSLFNLWKPGVAGKDNGLIILVAMDQRTVHFHTGLGIEEFLPDAKCKQIERDYMIPEFKNGDYDKGVLNGVMAAAVILIDPDNAVAMHPVAGEPDTFLADNGLWIAGGWLILMTVVFIFKRSQKSFASTDATAPQARLSVASWVVWYILLPVSVLALLILAGNTLLFGAGIYVLVGSLLVQKRNLMDRESRRWLERKEYHALYSFFEEKRVLFSALRFIFPVPFAFMYRGYKKRMDFFRNHPRDCKQCGKPLTKLDEEKDDAFLAKSQLLEESLKSVDYDVWRCSACNAADKLMYINTDSKYEPCPKCSTRAYYLVSDSVVRSATTSSEGLGRKIHQCKFCNERKTTDYSIARLSSSSSSSGGSSSSSGGSWGGGRSGGGGASSSW